MPAAAGIKFGQYVLLRRIARGGMAEVFLAQQRGLEGFDRRVAVKRILPHLADSPDFLKMFLGEAKLAAQLGHPNIVHIYEFGKVEDDYFIAMEYVEGVHAGHVFKHGEGGDRLTPTLIARIGADAAAALHYAHELRALGLVHRDVSPANIMVSFDGVVKLCDFGIAKAAALGDQLTNPGQVKGKYAYMSPEQTVAQPLDGRSDVFSLSIVLWELLAGKLIVPRGDAIAAMRALRDGRIEPIAKVAPSVPPPLARAITWGLETRREQRATATELAQALEAFIKSSPELATAVQLGGWIRQRFVRESAGQVPAVPAQGPGTVAAPSTSNTQNPVTPPQQTAGSLPRQLAASRPEVSDPELAADTNRIQKFAPISGATVIDRAPAPSGQVTAQVVPAVDPRFIVDPADPRLVAPTRAMVVAPRVEVAEDEPTLHVEKHTFVPTDTEIDPRDTVARSSAHVVASASGPAIAPHSGPRARTGEPSPRAPPPRRRATPLPIRAHRIRLAISIAGLVALAMLSFAIALAASGRHATAIAVDAATAAEPTSRPITAPASRPDAATTTGDASTDAYLAVITTPPGATVMVGDQAQLAPAELVVASGTFQVTIELAGYQPETRAVTIAPGEHQQLELALHRHKRHH